MGLYFLGMMLGKNLGASQWLTYVILLTTILVVVAGATYRKRNKLGRLELLFFVIGLLSLTVAGIVNEYVKNFFVPSILYLLSAVTPGLLVSICRAVVEKRN